MSKLLRLGNLCVCKGEYFLFKTTSKFISEALIIISAVVALSSIGILIAIGLELKNGFNSDEFVPENDPDPGPSASSRDIRLGLFVFTILILLVSVSDGVFAVILLIGIRKMRLSYCLFWKGATITSLLLTGMLTIAFITMVHNLYPMIGYIPSLIAKPFSLWIVNGFIAELWELRSFSFKSEGTGESVPHPPAKATFSLDDLETIKNSTTVFYMNKKFRGKVSDGNRQTPYVTATRLKAIPE